MSGRSDVDVRESFLRFPSWSQHFWTWLTGKPLRGQEPLFRPTCWSYLGSAVARLAAGMALSLYAVYGGSGLAALFAVAGVMLTLNAARTLALTIGHQCAHVRFTGRRKTDRALHQVISTFLLSQNAEAYRHDHFDLHHGLRTFTTAADPVLQFIIASGFRPGMPRRRLHWHLAWTFISPKFHFDFYRARLRSNLVITRGARRWAAAAWIASWLLASFLVPGFWAFFLIGYAVPVMWLYQTAALLELLCEHTWLAPYEPVSLKERRATHSWGRFCGAPVPARGAGLGRWLSWAAAMAFYHLPMRSFVMTGDACQHDFHHRYPATVDWVIAPYARQRDLEAGHPGWLPYHEVWGILRAIDIVFQAIENAPRQQEATSPTRAVEGLQPAATPA